MKRYIPVIAGSVILLGVAAAITWPFEKPVSYSVTLPPPDGYKPGAAAFLDSLYAHYNGKDQDFSPLGDQASKWFDPDLVDLMKIDGTGPEVGALDSDPVCDCQDYGRLSAQVTVLTADHAHARAIVVVTETDPQFDVEGRKPRTFTYDLIDVNHQWRIHDIATPSTASLRQLLLNQHQIPAADASKA
ncbi:DUF3828 domain-containing protein [Asticcacaulis sp. 201]|uniref:DUF3828 domain-containing protein n=1 Tax=Asticcacaulis sp. 201 TaxID=3028787 RepID=UPI0029167AC8|nr:DUF3828 domain-containing protein [Asticcacaulis sp. 201]MDV6330002.1 DUF3828 domain-containing protein [Asticcacaulis sp. 201]